MRSTVEKNPGQSTLETWEMKMTRLARDLAALRAETEFWREDDKRWRKMSPRYRALRYEIERHLRLVDVKEEEDAP